MTTASASAALVPEKVQRAPLGRLLRAELRWVLRHPRTWVGFGLLALVPLGLGLIMSLVDFGGNAIGGPPMLASLLGNGMVLPLAAMGMAMPLLMPMLISMSAADALAGESAHGTLRGLLIAPVGRVRLVAVAILPVIGILAGVLFTGTTEFMSLSGTTMSFAEGVGRVGLTALWVWLQMAAVASIALAISAFTDHPLVVLAATMGSLIVFTVLGSLADLAWLHPILITTGWPSVIDVVRDPIVTSTLAEGGLRALFYIAIGLSITVARMATKDS